MQLQKEQLTDKQRRKIENRAIAGLQKWHSCYIRNHDRTADCNAQPCTVCGKKSDMGYCSKLK